MRSFLLVIILALLLQGQGVPIEDFFTIIDASSSMSADVKIIDNLATDCGGATRLSVRFALHVLFNFQANSLAL